MTELKRRALVEKLAAQVSAAGAAPAWQASAPGRVNLIGDHTDYAGGFALPMAIDCYTVAVAAKAPPDRRTLRVHSAAQGWTEFDRRAPERADNWSDYLRGVLAGYRARGVDIPALDIWIDGDLPLGAGLSSSASLELAFAHLLEAVVGQTLDPADRARLCQRAEHEYAGMPCGILDQYAVTFAREGEALLLDCETQSTTGVPLPGPCCIGLVNSGVSHALVDGGYARRREEVAAAEAALGQRLRHSDSDDLMRIADPLLRRRARHVITENRRVHDFVAALTRGDTRRAGELMHESHRSLAGDFAVSCTEMDQLVAAALEVGALGARMTGGGFGGSMVALVESACVERFADGLSTWFAETFDRPADLRWVRPVAGAAGASL